MRNKILLLFIFCLILKPNISYSLVEIDITRGNLDPLPISVSPFFADEISKEKIKKNLGIDNLGLEISKVIENNLRKTGLFDALDNESLSKVSNKPVFLKLFSITFEISNPKLSMFKFFFIFSLEISSAKKGETEIGRGSRFPLVISISTNE